MNLTFLQSADPVEVYDFVEVTIRTCTPIDQPFTAVSVRGEFDGKAVDGFCDAQDGSVYRVRFMPERTGKFDYRITFRAGEVEARHQGRFRARDGGRKGLLRVDREHPWHFLWSGTNEHLFWNSTTTYLIAGCQDGVILQSLERLRRLKVNRIRVSLSPARVKDGMAWYEPVYPSEEFTFLYGPWLAARPESVNDPGWDVTRFDIAYWRKFERLLREARARDILVSVVFYTDGRLPGAYPFPHDQFGGNPDEERYYRCAAARLAPFANVMWDVSNEYQLFRNEAWAEAMGAFLSACDPYDHLMSVHGHEQFRFRQAPWADFAMYQCWDESGGYEFMLKNRCEQAAAGRPMPQVNEEYGYEDHYPRGWGGARVAPARAADNRRRLAWEITMAGGYQTTGEYAGNGLGGWINGRGDDFMTMLEGYARIGEFFTAFDWWKLEPRPDLAGGAMCLAEPGVRYVVYLPQGSSVSLQPEPGDYAASWYNPRTGETLPLPDAGESATATHHAPDTNDWVLHLQRKG
jgi:hypothetical protein